MIRLFNFVRGRVATAGSIFPRRCQGLLKNGKSRPYSSLSQSLISPKREQLYRNRDLAPLGYELIYSANVTNYINGFYPLAIISMALISSGWYYWKFVDTVTYPSKSTVMPVGFTSARQADFCYASYVLINIVTLLILRRTVLRIWHNAATGDYKIILVGTLPPRFTRQITCRAGDVWRKSAGTEKGLTDGIHKIRGRYYNMTIVDFRNPLDYYNLLGEP